MIKKIFFIDKLRKYYKVNDSLARLVILSTNHNHLSLQTVKILVCLSDTMKNTNCVSLRELLADKLKTAFSGRFLMLGL